MITLALLKQMVADNVANLEIDKNCFWEQAPLQKDGKPAQGVWLVTRGAVLTSGGNGKGLNLRSTVDFYVALANKPKTEEVHQKILEWILTNKCFCELVGSVGGVNYSFSNIRVRPTTTPQNTVVTENNLVVKLASAEVIYDIK